VGLSWGSYRRSGTVGRSIYLAYVFPTRTGRRQYECKIRDNMVKTSVKRANRNLEAKDLPPLPESVGPHSLRRTFATVLYAIGEPPPVVMAEMGIRPLIWR
jgi:integrase